MFVEQFTRHLQSVGIEPQVTWFEAGHDILYRVHRHGRIYERLAASLARDPRPAEVRVATGDYRAARQHWLTVTRLTRVPELGSLHGEVEEQTLRVDTDGVRAFSIDLSTCPLAGDEVQLVVDGDAAYEGPLAHLGHRVHLRKGPEGWALGYPVDPEGLSKRPGLSGPISDAYYGRMVHVWGTADAEATETLQRAAQRGTRGWPLWGWDVDQEAIADTALTDALIGEATVVLYGNAAQNRALARIADRLPIRVEADAVVVGDQRFEGRDVGVRFIYPNPLAPERYVIVQAGVDAQTTSRGNKLAEFLPDWAVYDASTVRGAQRRIAGRRLVASGFFDERWRVEGPGEGGSGPDSGVDPDAGTPTLPVPPAPDVPERPRRFRAPRTDQAGQAIRRIWNRVPTFHNFRAEIPGATWRTTRRAVWEPRASADCLQELQERQLPFRPRADQEELVPTPVELLGPIDGVWLRPMHEDQPIVISCELAVRLPALVAIFARHGVLGVDILSSLRSVPRTSFHTMGLALDISRFWTADGWMSVNDDFVETPMHETCDAPRPRGPKARALLAIACAMARSNLLSSVLTPNYNEGHRDHFHIDMRPHDPRVFLR